MATFEDEELLCAMISARTALKTNNTDRALRVIREVIKRIDPDRSKTRQLQQDLARGQMVERVYGPRHEAEDKRQPQHE